MSLIGRSVKITLKTPIKTHFSKGTKILYGTFKGETSHLIQVEIGSVDLPVGYKVQVHVISKDLIRSIKPDWIESVSRGNKSWYIPAKDYIPARDDPKGR